MSAFIVEDETINIPLGLFYIEVVGSSGYDEIPRRLKEAGYNIDQDETEIARLGQDMFNLNCEAVNQRYGENQAETFRKLNYKYEFLPEVTAAHAYNAINCWIYQCSEGNVPMTSQLFKTVSKISDALAHRIALKTPEVQKARWG